MVEPSGQRTMRTCLGAAAELTACSQLANCWSPPALLHCEGYVLYKPALARGAMSAAKRNGSLVSLDLASFETVRNCRSTLMALLREGLVDVVFCNEEEAAALSEDGGSGGSSTSTSTSTTTSGRMAAGDDARTQHDNSGKMERVEAAMALVLQHARCCVVSLGSKGAVARAADGESGSAPASKVSVVDTIGAGDLFSSGFLYAYLHGCHLSTCCAAGCAAGAEAVQTRGAALSQAAWLRLRAAVGGLVAAGLASAPPCSVGRSSGSQRGGASGGRHCTRVVCACKQRSGGAGGWAGSSSLPASSLSSSASQQCLFDPSELS